MQGRKNLEALGKLGEFRDLELKDATRRELEAGLKNIDPNKIQRCQRICSLNPEIQKTIRELKEGPECNQLKRVVVRLVSAAKEKDLLTNSSSSQEKTEVEKQIETEMQTAKDLLQQVEFSARSAYVFVIKEYLDRVGDEFNLKPETLRKLNLDFWVGVISIVVGVVVVVGAFVAGIPVLGPICAAAIFVGLGIYTLVKNKQERKKYEEYAKFCEGLLENNLID